MPLIDMDDLPASIRGHLGAAYLPPTASPSIKPLDELLTEIERRLIETALSRARQNKSRAAELLGISRPRLYRRIKELNLPDDTEPENGVAPRLLLAGHLVTGPGSLIGLAHLPVRSPPRPRRRPLRPRLPPRRSMTAGIRFGSGALVGTRRTGYTRHLTPWWSANRKEEFAGAVRSGPAG